MIENSAQPRTASEAAEIVEAEMYAAGTSPEAVRDASFSRGYVELDVDDNEDLTELGIGGVSEVPDMRQVIGHPSKILDALPADPEARAAVERLTGVSDWNDACPSHGPVTGDPCAMHKGHLGMHTGATTGSHWAIGR